MAALMPGARRARKEAKGGTTAGSLNYELLSQRKKMIQEPNGRQPEETISHARTALSPFFILLISNEERTLSNVNMVL